VFFLERVGVVDPIRAGLPLLLLSVRFYTTEGQGRSGIHEDPSMEALEA